MAEIKKGFLTATMLLALVVIVLQFLLVTLPAHWKETSISPANGYFAILNQAEEAWFVDIVGLAFFSTIILCVLVVVMWKMGKN